MVSGRAFNKALPFTLGTNLQQATYWAENGPYPSGITYASGIGMKIIRDQMAWNFALAGGGTAAINPSPGSYNSSSLTIYQETNTTIRSGGMTPFYQVTIGGVDSGANSGMCEVLGVALTSGTTYTSINVSSGIDYPYAIVPALPFAITSGNSIVLTNPTNQSQTQTITAASGMPALANGALPVGSFTANHNYPIGTWIYDTTWPPCTPQHMATFMGWIVAQSGMQGLNWEIFNEPDGGSWPVTSSILTQTYKLAYPAMKAADPTCKLNGLCLQNIDTSYTGTAYYNNCVALGILGYYDVVSVHVYPYSPTDTPDTIGGYNYSLWNLLALFQQNRLSLGDNTPLWITECGWQYSGGAGLSQQFQAQCLQNFLNTLTGYDPINKVQFSEYLTAFIHYWIVPGTDPYGIVPNSIASPAVSILTELVTGH